MQAWQIVHPLLGAHIGTQQRARPGGSSRLGEHGQLQRGEIAHPHPQHALPNGLRHCCVIDLVQQARQAIATTRHQCHIGTTFNSTIDGGEPGGIVSCKTLYARQGIGVHSDGMAHGLQATYPTTKGRLVANGTRRGVHINMPLARKVVGSIVLRMIVIVIVIVIVGMWMGMRFGHGTQAAPALDNFKRPSDTAAPTCACAVAASAGMGLSQRTPPALLPATATAARCAHLHHARIRERGLLCTLIQGGLSLQAPVPALRGQHLGSTTLCHPIAGRYLQKL